MAISSRLETIREDFEIRVANYIGVKHAVTFSSGRTAIRLSLLALGVGHNDEVIIPDFACQILPITVFCTGASPRFCDIDRKTIALSPVKFQNALKKETKAVIFTHLYGLPADPSSIIKLAQERNIAVIDDAAQALGASINGKKAGSFGKIGILSLNKFLNVKLGGVALTDDDALAHAMIRLRERYERKSLVASVGYGLLSFLGLSFGKIAEGIFLSDKYTYELLHTVLAKKHFEKINGWVNPKSHIVDSWRLNALADKSINQLMTFDGSGWHRRRLEKLEILSIKEALQNSEKYLDARRKIAEFYQNRIKEQGLTKINIPEKSIASYMKYPIIISDEKRLSLCIRNLINVGFSLNYRYKPLHQSLFFKGITEASEFEESTYLSKHILPLPVDPRMDTEQMNSVVSIVNSSE